MDASILAIVLGGVGKLALQDCPAGRLAPRDAPAYLGVQSAQVLFQEAEVGESST